MTIGDFAEKVYMYCRLTNGSVTSWIRSPQRNKDVGGVAYSSHQIGLGADVTYEVAVETERRMNWAKRLGLRLVIESDHDHLQPLEWAAG